MKWNDLMMAAALMLFAIQPAAAEAGPNHQRRQECFQICHARCVQAGGTFGSASKNFRCSNRCSRRCSRRAGD